MIKILFGYVSDKECQGRFPLTLFCLMENSVEFPMRQKKPPAGCTARGKEDHFVIQPAREECAGALFFALVEMNGIAYNVMG